MRRPPSDREPAEEARHGRRRRRPPTWLRPAVLGAAALGLFLLGFLAHYLVARPRAPSQPPPTTDHPPSSRPLASVLEVRCRNTSAKVFLDGQYKGKTRLVLPWRVETTAPHTVRVSLQADGFASHEEQVELRPGDWTTVEVTLEPRAAPTPLVSGVVCIDPGHPSEVSSGDEPQQGTNETHINWVVALKLKEALQKAGFKVVMTKQSEGELVTNRRRAEIANDAGAAMMIRLHCDTGAASRSGYAVYYPEREGRKGNDTGPPEEVRRRSRTAAEAVHGGLTGGLAGTLTDNGLLTDAQTAIGRKQGALTGSIYALVPVVTVEMVFLTNPKDAAFIKGEEGQRRMAEALAEGVIRFVGGSAGLAPA